MKCVEDCCGLYGVPFYRMQSRVFTVIGAGGRERPMMTGSWHDKLGRRHTGGITDFLLTPAIEIHGVPGFNCITVPLWVEVKAGRDRLAPEQKEFRDYIQATPGGYWLVVKDGPEDLLEWFKNFGVRKP